MTIKIEFPADRKDIALAIGKALVQISDNTTQAVIETQGAPRKDKPTIQVETETTSHEQLAVDGAGLIDETVEAEQASHDVPPIVESNSLDSRGFPWDERIHSAKKSKNTDGTWRYSRKPKNFETKEQWDIYIEQIEEELLNSGGSSTTVERSSDVPPPVENDEQTAGNVFGQQQEDVPPPVENDILPPTDQHEEKTFGELMTLITSNQKDGSVEKINEVLTEMGITGTGNSALPVLKADHPERISEAYAKLEGKL